GRTTRSCHLATATADRRWMDSQKTAWLPAQLGGGSRLLTRTRARAGRRRAVGVAPHLIQHVHHPLIRTADPAHAQIGIGVRARLTVVRQLPRLIHRLSIAAVEQATDRAVAIELVCGLRGARLYGATIATISARRRRVLIRALHR